MLETINTNEIATKVATNIIEDSAKSLWNKVKKYFKDANAKEDIDLGIAYERYLSQTKEKYGKIKTLIYNRIRENLYNFYVNTQLKYEDSIIDTSNINNIICLTNKIIITGTGGIGKSTLLHHLFLNTIKTTSYIPVLIELRSFNSLENNFSIRNEIYKSLKNNGFELEDEYFEYSLKEGGYIFLLDGYDELKKDITEKISNLTQEFADQYSKNHYILSSRPSQEFIGWHDFDELSTLPLSKNQAIELIQKIKFDNNIKEKFLIELEKELYDKHKSFAENPLLLTIMLLTYESNAKIPENLNDFYERAFLTLFSNHDATKDMFERETCTGLGYDKFKLIFSYVCFISYFNDDYEFTDVKLHEYLSKAQKKFPKICFNTEDFQDDLIQHVCMLVKDGLKYRFSHRSFQEYFAAVYTCQLIDENQVQLFKTKLLKFARESENYFKMLYDMQRERFIKNIIIPGLNELYKQIGDEGFSFKCLSLLYDEFIARDFQDKKSKTMFRISGVTIIDEENDYYLYNVINILLGLCLEDLGYSIDYPSENKEKEIEKSTINIIKEIYGEYIPNHRYEISIEELKIIDNKLLEDSFYWDKQRFTLAMNILKKGYPILSEKKSIHELLDEL